MKKELNVNDTPFNKKNCEKGFILCGLIISMIKLMKVKKNCLFRSSAKSFAKICVKKKLCDSGNCASVNCIDFCS